jgi:hypothetical protein
MITHFKATNKGEFDKPNKRLPLMRENGFVLTKYQVDFRLFILPSSAPRDGRSYIGATTCNDCNLSFQIHSPTSPKLCPLARILTQLHPHS